ncbi:Acetylcholinesterase [Nymphon striatum]|nr:Acetylcholinesterase [Nymphon striatum]
MAFNWLIICMVLSHSLLLAGAEDYVTVKTAYGPVKGLITTSKDVKIAEFLGIPYAKPPIGSKRFSRPEGIDPWQETYNATEFKSSCFPSQEFVSTPKSEDCLYLNIWAPRHGTSRLVRPVLVFIHGGGFMDGTGRNTNLLRFSALTNAVVVSMNYRLNLFGNMGLLDQQLALEWVKKSIDAFGGDSNDITIFGISAGGASVGYQLLSPKSHNLFKRAIMQSGSPTDTWAFDSKVSAITKAKDLADLVKCNSSDATENPKRLIKCLQKVPAKLLASKNVHVKIIKTASVALVRPVLVYIHGGGFMDGTGRNTSLLTFSALTNAVVVSMNYRLNLFGFLNLYVDESPGNMGLLDQQLALEWIKKSIDALNYLDKGSSREPEIIVGTDRNDGGSFVQGSFPEYFKHGFPTGPQVVNITKRMYPELSEKQLTKVLKKYFKNLDDPLLRKNNTIEAGFMIGDAGFLCPSLYFAESMTNFGGKAHYYLFDHKKIGSTSWVDVPHVAEILYIFGTVLDSASYTESEKELSKLMTSKWLEFAKNGFVKSKTFTWPVYSEVNRNYYKIDIGKQQIKENDLLVQTSYGSVKGELTTTRNVASFLGIPYAKPPIGDKRFARPEAIEPWQGILDTTKYKPDCFQMHKPNDHQVSEDCLYLNIWSPRNGTSRLRQVFVYIHGGGFHDGSAQIPGLIFSSLSDTVVVSINYRLNVFGFLNLYIDEVPGNMGLLDQQLALKWVKMNIEKFGGNSRDVTIIGLSAGGASVGYHLLSPKSEDLFKRAAMHSGSPIDTWAFDSKVSTTAKAMQLADLVKCNRSDVILNPGRLKTCLQEIPANILNDTNIKVKLLQPWTSSFIPTVDGYFISQTPYELISQGKFQKTEVIIGTDKNDGASCLPIYFPEYFKTGFPTIQQIVELTKRMYSELSDAQLAAVILRYFGNLNPYHTRYAAIEAGYMISDTGFLCPSLYFAQSITKFGGKAFYYQFSHRKSGSTDWIGVPHGADMAYVLGVVQEYTGFTQDEKALSRRMMSQWINFAKTGDPSFGGFKWPVYSKHNRTYYKIYTDRPDTGIGPRTEFCDFWNHLNEIIIPVLKYVNILFCLLLQIITVPKEPLKMAPPTTNHQPPTTNHQPPTITKPVSSATVIFDTTLFVNRRNRFGDGWWLVVVVGGAIYLKEFLLFDLLINVDRQKCLIFFDK